MLAMRGRIILFYFTPQNFFSHLSVSGGFVETTVWCVLDAALLANRGTDHQGRPISEIGKPSIPFKSMKKKKDREAK